jgi:ADP-heptose:LPS heptosyltransferase
VARVSGTLPESVLIVRLSALGDVIHTLPALATLRAGLPEARIGWVVEERCADLLRGHPHIDQLIVVPRKAMAAAARAWRMGEAKALLRDVTGAMRERPYEVAADFQGNAKSAIVGWLSKAKRRVGFAPPDCKEGSHLLTTERIGRRPAEEHRIAKYLELARVIAGGAAAAEPVVPVDGAARARAEAWWGTERPRVLLAPGSSTRMPEKRWPHYAELARLLAVSAGATVGVTYGPGEEPLVEPIPARRPDAPPPLLELIALLATADLVIANDSAPMHLAAQLGTPTLGLFGPTDPVRFAPWGPRAAFLRAPGPCATCDRGAPRGVDTHACLPGLAPAEVVADAQRLLASA